MLPPCASDFGLGVTISSGTQSCAGHSLMDPAHPLHRTYLTILDYTSFSVSNLDCKLLPKRIVIAQVLELDMTWVPNKDV